MADGDVSADSLRACYEAFVTRRAARGASSVRTRQGYARLRAKYQPRLRLLQEAAKDEIVPLTTPYPPQENEVAAEEEGLSAQEREDDSEEAALRQLVGVFVDVRVKRLVLDTIWPLAHHGGDTEARRLAVPEWRELEQHKYFAFMFKTMLWLFPGLPAFEAQEQAENDWSKDCEFDAFGTDGLSFEGFMVSLLDLALACTDSTVGKCVEFLTHLTRRLETSLPIFRVPTSNVLPSPTDDEGTKVNMHEPIVWKTVPLEKLFPCPVHARPQFIELKVKLSTAPLVLMVLAGNERQFELQISTSAKVLVREQDHRSSIRRNTMQSHALSHFIEVEEQFLWTFRSFPGRPTLVIIPSGLISKRTLSLYSCCRLLASHEHTVSPTTAIKLDTDPLLTLFTSVHDPFPLLQGPENSLCGRVDRQSSRLFVIDHRAGKTKRFQVTFKTSLIHNTSSAGGVGAAAVVSQLPHVDSAGTAECKSDLIGGSNPISMNSIAHSYIFVVKVTSTILECGPERRRASTNGAGRGTARSTEASIPAQWFTTLRGSNENKTIYIDATDSSEEVYYVYAFTLHGFYFEASYEYCTETNIISQEADNSPLSLLINSELRQSRSANHSPGSVFRLDEDTADDPFGRFEAAANDTNRSQRGLQNVSKSATLLRQLLSLRRQRQHQMTQHPPPDCIGGSKITSMKVLTAAAGLRAKFLRAREAERRSRFLKHEESLQAKVLEKLMKAEAKKRVLRGDRDVLNSLETQEHLSDNTDAHRNSDLHAKATLIANFFKEMAVFQPSKHELDEASSEEAARAELENDLLDDFADLFDDDHALQNILDAEKWLSAEDKVTRRQSILVERVKNRRQSLLQLRKQQVPELHHELPPERASDQRSTCASTRASEDYYSTAQLISQLMREVADEENAQLNPTLSEINRIENPTEADGVRQLVATWMFATNIPMASQHADFLKDSKATQIPRDLAILEAVRGDSWLQSHYARSLAVNERLQQLHSTFKSTLLPTQQDMGDQEKVLPWAPVWEVQHSGSEHACRHQRSRPKTADSVPFSPRPPSASPHVGFSSASHSAAFARQHTRRIRSARAGIGSRQSNRNPGSCGILAGSRDCNQDSIPNASIDWTRLIMSSSMETPEGAGCSTVMASQEDKLGKLIPSASGTTEVGSITSVSGITAMETRVLLEQVRASQDGEIRTSESVFPVEVPARNANPKIKRKKKRSAEAKRFDKRVEELLSISPLLQSFSNSGYS